MNNEKYYYYLETIQLENGTLTAVQKAEIEDRCRQLRSEVIYDSAASLFSAISSAARRLFSPARSERPGDKNAIGASAR